MKKMLHVNCLLVFAALLLFNNSAEGNDSCSVSGFASGPMNITVYPSEILNTILMCSISGFPSSGKIWNHYLNGKELHRIATNFFIPSSASYSFAYDRGSLTLLNNSVLYHGEYYCNLQNPCPDVISPSGYINIISPILMMFQEDTENSTVVNVTSPLYIPMHMFGYPPPQLTLFKQKEAINGVDQGFDVVTSSHVAINTSGVSFDAVEFTDEGFYELRAQNSEGNTSISFTITILGTDDHQTPPPSCTSECIPHTYLPEYYECCDSDNFGNFIKIMKSGVTRGYIMCLDHRPDWC